MQRVRCPRRDERMRYLSKRLRSVAGRTNVAGEVQRGLRLLWVVPRFGGSTVGGAEPARRRARDARDARGWSSEVATTYAVDHYTWADELQAGHARRGAALLVHRFEVRASRRPALRAAARHRSSPEEPFDDEPLEWLANSVWSPASSFLEEHAADYDLTLFAPFCFSSGRPSRSPGRARRSALRSLLHDEPYRARNDPTAPSSRFAAASSTPRPRSGCARSITSVRGGRRGRNGVRPSRSQAPANVSPRLPARSSTCSTQGGSRRGSARARRRGAPLRYARPRADAPRLRPDRERHYERTRYDGRHYFRAGLLDDESDGRLRRRTGARRPLAHGELSIRAHGGLARGRADYHRGRAPRSPRAREDVPAAA